jgi:hypothetical protein
VGSESVVGQSERIVYPLDDAYCDTCDLFGHSIGYLRGILHQYPNDAGKGEQTELD